MAEEEGEELGFEQKLERALSSRVQHFKDKTDALTLGSVRRLLEEDLGLQKFALDPHKKFIREYLTKELRGTDDGNAENATEDVEKDVNLSKEETTELPKQHETKNGPKDSGPEDEKLMKDSPIMGVLTTKSEFGAQGSTVDESGIKKAVWKRADYFLANSETITLCGVRRLLEEDLGLEKNALDSFKRFLRQEIDQVLNSPRSAKSAKDVKKKTSESSKPAKDVKQKASKSSQAKKSEKVSREEESSGGESDEPNSEVKPQRKAAAKPKDANSKGPKKRKISEDNDHDVSGKKQKKIAKSEKEENASDEDECTSQDDQSQSSTGKQALRAKLANSYGKRIDKLKAVIKSCGMSVPPTIYKKAKQVPDDEREAFIFEELRGILSKEGLSESPTDKDIKACRKRKETARELEGIDRSNIMSSSRRRSSASFVSPPKPAISSMNEKTKAKDKKKKEASDNEINDSNEEDKEKEKAEKLENDVKEEKKDDEEEVEEEEEGEDEEDNEEDNEDDDEDDDDEEDEESEEFNGGDDEDSD